MVPNMPEEIWKTIPGYSCYEASTTGRIRRVVGCDRAPAGKLLKPYVRADGYLQIGLSNNGRRKLFLVHQIVMQTFREVTPKGQEIRHLDGDKFNCSLDNLQFGTPKQNGEDNSRNGIFKGERGSNARLCNAQVLEIRKRRVLGETTTYLAKVYNVGVPCICNIVNRKTWSHI